MNSRTIGGLAFLILFVWPALGLSMNALDPVHGGSSSTCATSKSTVVRVPVSASKYPAVLDHIEDAQAGRTRSGGWPTVLRINRRHADDRRDAGMAMSGLPPRDGYQRDEYPPAFARTTNAADFRYVPERQNSGQGATMGNRLRGCPNGQAFRLTRAP